MRVKLLRALEPSLDNARLLSRRNDFWRGPVRLAMSRWTRLSASGTESLLRDRPMLFLSNHAGFFDPLAISIMAQNTVPQMATASNFRRGIVGRFFSHFGAIPKKKYEPDLAAVRRLKRWVDAGICVGLFPEGERTWDGRPLPLVAGIEKLVRLLGLPVVTARILNADRQSPRWAVRMRRGRIHIAFDPPRVFARDTSLQEIRDYIQSRILVDPLDCPRWPVSGSRLAEGLANLVFQCPACARFEALVTRGDFVSCTACAARWRVSPEGQLHGHAGAHDFSITQAVDLLRERISRDWISDLPSFERDGTVLASEPMELLDISGDEASVIARGQLLLTPTAIRVAGPLGWQAPLEELDTVSVDMRRRLTFRHAAHYFEVVLPRDSAIKWEWFLNEWRRRSRTGAPPAASDGTTGMV